MKKIISVFLAALLVFGTVSFAMADTEPDASTTVVTAEENTTRNIKNKDGLVVPINLTQLKQSIIFKIIEKFFKFVLSLFGAGGADVDNSIATEISDVNQWVDQVISEAQSNLNNQ